MSNSDGSARDVAGPIDAPASDVRPVLDRPLADVPGDGGGKACSTSCDDNNPCTIDSCDTTTGACVNTVADEGSICENSCVAGGQGHCTLGICSGTAVADGTSCEDGDPCTLGDTCKNGLCFSGPAMPCPAIDICHETGHCEQASGTCTAPKSGDGKACDDGLACTTGDQCGDGVCAGVALACAKNASCEAAAGICKAGDRIAFPSATLAVKFPGASLATVGALAQDGAGNLFLVGSTTSILDLGSGSLIPAGKHADAAAGSDVLVAKLDPATGSAVWAELFGDQLGQLGGAIAVNRQGQAAISGMFIGSLAFGGTTITNPAADHNQAFVAAVDAATGTGLWAVWPQIAANTGLALAADPTTSDFVVCGSASGSGAIGLVPSAASADEGDIVVARLDARTGVPAWGRQIAAPGRQTCDSVAVDLAGHVLLAGTMASLKPGAGDAGVASGLLDLGSGVQLDLPVAPSGGSAIVIWAASLDATTGNTLAASRFGAPNGGSQSVRQIACDAAGNVLLAGGIRNLAVVGDTTLTVGSLQNALLVKLDAQLVPLWARTWGGANATVATLAATEPAGSLIVAGTYTRVLDLDGIALALGETAASSSFVARIDGSSGAVLAARGYGGPGVTQSSYGLQIMGSGSDVGAIWLAGMFTKVLQMGPPAALLTATVADTAFLGRIGP